MLTPRQDKELDIREPDVRMCPHHIEVTEMGDRRGPRAFILRLKGHMIMDGDAPDEAGEIHVEDHRLFCVEIPMIPDIWDHLLNSLNDVNDEIKRVVRDQNLHLDGHGRIDPEAIARFMNGIPEIFLRDPREDDK